MYSLSLPYAKMFFQIYDWKWEDDPSHILIFLSEFPLIKGFSVKTYDYWDYGNGVPDNLPLLRNDEGSTRVIRELVWTLKMQATWKEKYIVNILVGFAFY